MLLFEHSDRAIGLAPAPAPAEDAEALLEELRSATELMQSLATADTVLSVDDRRVADSLSEKLATLYRAGRRSLSQS